MDVENKGLNQLLLSPLYLFDQLLSVVRQWIMLQRAEASQN
jgi:hypothetical protein